MLWDLNGNTCTNGVTNEYTFVLGSEQLKSKSKIIGLNDSKQLQIEKIT